MRASFIRRASHNACVSRVAVGVGAAVFGISRAIIAVDGDAIVTISPPVTPVVGRCGAAVAAAHAQSAAMKIALNAAPPTQTSRTPEIRETTSTTRRQDGERHRGQDEEEPPGQEEDRRAQEEDRRARGEEEGQKRGRRLTRLPRRRALHSRRGQSLSCATSCAGSVGRDVVLLSPNSRSGRRWLR